jgi:aerobic-type carbon monoxide dehydrogenase small subunit (CoxS/CutS family)
MKEQILSIEIEVNGTLQHLKVVPHTTLLEILRGQLGLKGSKEGCGIGQCGACTVLLNGNPVNACLLLAVQADGQKVETIESLANQDQLHPLQAAFVDEHAVQCGFCTPGMLISSKALLDKNPQPEHNEILQAISGNVCRCSGYSKIVKAVKRSAGEVSFDK